MIDRGSRSWFDRIEMRVWAPGRDGVPGGGLMRVVRTVVILVRDMAAGQLTLRAMGLVYTTLLSIVPLLALSFSVLKAFGVTNQIQPMLLSLLEPLGVKGVEVALRITGFIENMNVGVLGAVGLVLLLYTSVSLIQKIEESLNYIWHAPRPRPLGERFTRYLTVLLIGPLLVFAALAVTASLLDNAVIRSLMAVDLLGQTVQVVSRMVPYLLIIVAFTFVYRFIPNTRVRFWPALIGGAVGGIAWQSAGWLFALFIAGSNNYSAIYASFAILILFMIWLYISWLVLLFGASAAFYVQHPEYLYLRGGEPRLSNRMRERLALSAMEQVTRRFLAGEAAPTQHVLTQLLRIPTHALTVVLDALEDNGLLIVSGDEPPSYLPARDPGQILVGEVLKTVRAAGEDRYLSPAAIPSESVVESLVVRLEQAADAAVAGLSLRDLVQQSEAATQPPRGEPIWVEPTIGG